MKYNPENCEEFFKRIRLGLSMTDACAIVGISDETYYAWCKNHLEFLEGVKKARAECKQMCIATIQKASIKSWQAAAWLLERKHPEEFGMRTHQQISGYIERGEDEADKKHRKERVTKRLNEILQEKVAVGANSFEKVYDVSSGEQPSNTEEKK